MLLLKVVVVLLVLLVVVEGRVGKKLGKGKETVKLQDVLFGFEKEGERGEREEEREEEREGERKLTALEEDWLMKHEKDFFSSSSFSSFSSSSSSPPSSFDRDFSTSLEDSPYFSSSPSSFSSHSEEKQQKTQQKKQKKQEKTLPQPELTSSRVLPMEAYVMNERYEYVVTSLEFDQDLYLNEPFVCAGNDLECTRKNCTPCDWSIPGENRTSCLDDTCCGPSEWPTLAAYSKREEWCDDSQPPFTKLNFGEISEKFIVEYKEMAYFRFFVSEDDFCKPISITVHTDYGQTQLLVHNLLAYPNWTNFLDFNFDYRTTYIAGKWERENGLFNYGQSVLDICPNVNPSYGPGTYSIGIEGLSAYTRFAIELRLGEDEYPLTPPDDRVNCTDVPEEEFNTQVLGDRDLYGDTICLEEGVTKSYLFQSSDNSKLFEIIMPVLPGCREIQFAYNGYTGQGVTGADSDNDLYCFQSSGSDSLFTAVIGRSRTYDDTFYFAGCFDEITYLHCTSQSFSGSSSTGMFYWTSRATPRRYKMTDLSPGMLSMVTGTSHAAALAPDLAYETFLNWGFTGFSYITQPSEDPLVFWPPFEPFIYNFTGTPSEVYEKEVVREGLKSNLLVVVDITTRKNQEVRNRDKLLENGFIIVPGITNIEGTPVKLKNNGKELSNRSITEWVPHQTFKSLNVMHDFSELCDSERYFRELELVSYLTDVAIESNDLETISEETYLNNIYNAALARSACVQAVERSMETINLTFPRIEINYCDFEFESEEWYEDPCCNVALQAWQCCAPQVITDATEVYAGANEDFIEPICNNDACAKSYYNDISASLNARGNPLLGCSSGIRDPNFELTVRIESELERFVRPCLEEAGFGSDFLGVQCLSDEDCENIGYGCTNEGICALGSTEETQNRYFDCFLERMSAPVEEYIRRYKVNPVYSWLPLDSLVFREEVRASATIQNCINPNNPLDLSQSERWVTDAVLSCKRFAGPGYNILTEVEQINSACPPRICLGDETCRYVNVTDCRQTPGGCDAYSHSYLPPLSEEECPIIEEDCNVFGGANCSGFVCVGCDSDGECEEVVGVGEEDCGGVNGTVLCVTAQGERRYDLTEEECLNLEGECDVNCEEDKCVSGFNFQGYCMFTSLNASTCSPLGSWTQLGSTNGFCGIFSVRDEATCDLVGNFYGLPTHFATCNDLTIDECANPFLADSVYYYLYCTIDAFNPCETEEACLASGGCSDMDEGLYNYFDRSTQRYVRQYGGCFASGTKGITSEREPFCYWPESEQENNYACRYSLASVGTEEECAALNTTGENDVWRRTRWIYPAKTRETCLDKGFGRYGCILPGTNDIRPYFWLEEACECQQGRSDYVFEWTEPTWNKPKAYPLEWKEKIATNRYQYGDFLSIITMENWVKRAIEGLFVEQFKSQVVCENNYLTSSLSTLVCDCYSGSSDDDTEDDDDTCYSSTSIETRVGISGACHNETGVLKGPPSFTTFYPDSIKERCTEVYLDLIQRSWFSFPPSSAGVSFQFAERRQKGTVLNKNDATVGELMGDGSKVTFRFPERLNYFHICVLVSESGTSNNDYTVRDFGTPDNDFTHIRPLGVEGIREEVEESLVYWCADLDRDYLQKENIGERESVTLFPVYVKEGWEDEQEDLLSDRTEGLVYTLGACYIFDLILIIIYLVVIVHSYVRQGRSVPLIMWIGVIFGLVCIFRIAFCFVYVDGGFEGEELAEYVVFEIPTFLIFTAVILALMLFMRLSRRSSFDFKGRDKKLWTLGFLACACVWSLFIVVTVVYSEVILEEESENDCPGRVEDDNSKQEEDTRTLSIIYQSIVIFLTLVFGLAFLRSAIVLFTLTKGGASHAKRFIFRIGSVIVVSFFLRCILFLILLAIELTSDIYLFITLFLTEVIMMLLVALEFNQRFYNKVTSNVASVFSDNSGSFMGSGGTSASQAMSGTAVDD